MTWKEFKAQAEARGISDDSTIWYIDIDAGKEEIDVWEDDEHGRGWVIV